MIDSRSMFQLSSFSLSTALIHTAGLLFTNAAHQGQIGIAVRVRALLVKSRTKIKSIGLPLCLSLPPRASRAVINQRRGGVA